MKKYRKVVVTEVRAIQWFKNGDHPNDDCHMVYPDKNSLTQFEPFLSEGKIVRRFRHPDFEDDLICNQCGKRFIDRGFIEVSDPLLPLGGVKVCPGDWILHHTTGQMEVLHPEHFALVYEEVVE